MATLPLDVIIEGDSHEVRPYIPQPVQCKNCSGFPYSMKVCWAEAVCAPLNLKNWFSIFSTVEISSHPLPAMDMEMVNTTKCCSDDPYSLFLPWTIHSQTFQKPNPRNVNPESHQQLPSLPNPRDHPKFYLQNLLTSNSSNMLLLQNPILPRPP